MKTQLATLTFKKANLFAALCLIIFCASFAKGQNNSFYSMVAQQDKYYDSLIKIRGHENMQGTGYRPYLRWKLYWMGKINNGGTMEGAYEAMLGYTNNFGRLKTNFNTTLQTWNSLGLFKRPYNIPANDSSGMAGVGRIHALAFDPSNPNRIYAMSPSWGGLYRSDNNGINWTQVQTNDVDYEGFGWLLVDNTNPDTLYLANGDSDGNYYTGQGLCQNTGIFRSTNGGSNWTQIFIADSNQRHHFIRKVIMDPNDHNVLLVATDYGLYRCNNATAAIPTFIKATDNFNIPLDSSFIDIEYRAGSNNEVYVSGRHQNYLYKSINDGTTWTKIINPLLNPADVFGMRGSQIEFSAADPNTLYFLAEHSVSGYTSSINVLYLLNLTSMQWQKKDTLLYVNQVQKGFAVSPTNPNELYAGGMLNRSIYKSLDKGNSWSPLTSYYHIDIHHLDFSSDGVLWAGTDGGMHKYNTATNTWTDCTNMSISNIGKYSFSISPSDTNLLVMGCYDNGSNLMDKSYPGTNKWKQVDGGDGTACLFDYADGNTFYTSSLGGDIIRHDRINNSGYHLAPVSKNNKAYNSLAIDAGNHKLIYMITDTAVYRSYSRGDNGTWQKISTNLNTAGILRSFYRLVTSPTTPGVLYLQNISTTNGISYSHWWRTFSANATNIGDVTWEPYNYDPAIFVNDLALDPLNPKQGWAALAGYDSPTKIMQFSETGWQNITHNLYTSNIPSVSCLVYDRASAKGRLYAGTWFGVYYLDKGTTQWELLDGMPDADLTNIDIQYISGKLIGSTWGKGVWETSIRNTACSGPISITKDSTLLFGSMSLCDIIIKTGKTFTVKGLLAMGQNTKITVERGAKLIVDGGKVTSLPGFMWQGIEVWGDSTKTQAYNSTYQGVAKFINKAVIENAKVAVVTIRYDGTANYAYTGGVIQATDATFRNCTYGVVFYKYENRHPLTHKVMDNVSAFTRCAFEANNSYLGTDTLRNMVELSEVRGIAFGGCAFKSGNTSSLGTEAAGIFSYNSSFRVQQTCKTGISPCAEYVPCSFDSLRYGIRATGAATTKTFTVANAVFTSNTCGLFCSAIDFTSIVQNTFNVTQQDTSINPSNAIGGLFTEQCKFYTIEENTFNGVIGLHPKKYVGLTISNSGPYNNQVYKNTFNSLDIGILAQGKNKKPGENNTAGLCFKCNDFNTCKYDIAITAPNNANYDSCGVAKYQGASIDPSGNLFTALLQNPIFQFWNLGEPNTTIPIVTYFYHNNSYFFPRLKPTDSKTTNITPIQGIKPYNPNTTCPSNLNINPNITDKLVYDSKADSVYNELKELVDNGSTEQLAAEISQAFPTEALELHDELLQQSPYISDTVLRLAIEKEEVLNNALLKDVLVANPQTAKSFELMEAVDARWNPMPEYMKDEIMEGVNQVSEKEKLEAQEATYRQKADMLFNRVVSNYLSDTANTASPDTAYMLIKQSNKLSHRYLSALMEFENVDTLNSNTILTEIANNYYPDGVLSQEYISQVAYYQLIKNQGMIKLPVASITNLQAQMLSALICSNCIGSAWARNLLLASGNIEFEEKYILPDGLKTGGVPSDKKKPIQSDIFFKAYPNPSHGYVVFEYGLKASDKVDNTFINITDNRGINCDQIKVKRNSNQIVYATGDLIPGVYTCTLVTSNNSVAHTKLIVIE
jgi:hypothetical protein